MAGSSFVTTLTLRRIQPKRCMPLFVPDIKRAKILPRRSTTFSPSFCSATFRTLTGWANPDGHLIRAVVADVFYGDMDHVPRRRNDLEGRADSSSPNTWDMGIRNKPGDGIYDKAWYRWTAMAGRSS